MSRFLLCTAIVLGFSAPAWAGFTLLKPKGGEVAPPATAVPAPPVSMAPVPNMAPSMMLPPVAPAPAPAFSPAPMAAPQSIPLAPIPAPTMPTANANNVQGFGNDIPLIIATQQIAPEGRQVAFGDGIDPAQPISWQGGQDWRATLTSALGARGLVWSEQGNMIFINSNAPAPIMTPAAMPVAPAPKMIAPTPMPEPQASNIVTLPTLEMPPAAPVVEPAALPVAAPLSADQPVIPAPQPRMAHTPVAVQPVPLQAMEPIAAPPAPALAPALSEPTVQALPPVVAAPISMPAPMPTLNEKVDEISNSLWQANTGRTLKQTLDEWAERANVTLRWDSEFDYPVQSNVTVEGDFETAVRTLLRGFTSAQPQPTARLYRPNAGAPGVLLVTPRGNDLSEGF